MVLRVPGLVRTLILRAEMIKPSSDSSSSRWVFAKMYFHSRQPVLSIRPIALTALSTRLTLYSKRSLCSPTIEMQTRTDLELPLSCTRTHDDF